MPILHLALLSVFLGNSNPAADADWATLQQVINPNRSPAKTGDAERDVINACRHKEVAMSEYRTKGAEFWDKYPDDARRYDWLVTAGSVQVFYFKNQDEGIKQYARSLAFFNPVTSPRDAAKQAAWQKKYAEYRRDFMADPNVKDLKKAELWGGEIMTKLSEAQVAPKGKKQMAIEIQKELLEFAAKYPSGAFQTVACVKELLSEPDRFDLDDQTARGFFDDFKKSPNQPVAKLATFESRINEFRTKPIDLKFTSMDGKEIDLAKYRGKPVILEFSAITWCYYCGLIRPVLKELNDKYQGQGVEMVTILYDEAKFKDTVEKTLKEEGCDWPHWLSDSRNGPEFSQNLGISSIPRTFFIDKNGLLVQQSLGYSLTVKDRFENLIRKMLDLPSLDTAH